MILLLVTFQNFTSITNKCFIKMEMTEAWNTISWKESLEVI